MDTTRGPASPVPISALVLKRLSLKYIIMPIMSVMRPIHEKALFAAAYMYAIQSIMKTKTIARVQYRNSRRVRGERFMRKIK